MPANGERGIFGIPTKNDSFLPIKKGKENESISGWKAIRKVTTVPIHGLFSSSNMSRQSVLCLLHMRKTETIKDGSERRTFSTSEKRSTKRARGEGRGEGVGGGGGDATIFVSTFIVSTCRLQLAFVYP